MKKKTVVLLLALILLSTGVLSTAAYFTTEGTAHNVITSGKVSIKVIEKYDTGSGEADFPQEPVSGVMPGSDQSKIVTVKNTGRNSAWVRVALNIQASDPDGQKVIIPRGAISVEILEGWVDGHDGWYYYETPLEAGATTQPAFESVHFSEDLDNAFKNSTVTVKVLAQAVQDTNNGIPGGGTVADVVGWPDT